MRRLICRSGTGPFSSMLWSIHRPRVSGCSVHSRTISAGLSGEWWSDHPGTRVSCCSAMVFLIYLWKGPITHDPIENMEFAHFVRYYGSIEGNTLFFNELGSDARRRLIDVQQRGAALRRAQSELRRRFTGSMAWKTRSNRDYLYCRNGPIDKSLGPQPRRFTPQPNRDDSRLQGPIRWTSHM